MATVAETPFLPPVLLYLRQPVLPIVGQGTGVAIVGKLHSIRDQAQAGGDGRWEWTRPTTGLGFSGIDRVWHVCYTGKRSSHRHGERRTGGALQKIPAKATFWDVFAAVVKGAVASREDETSALRYI